MKTRSNAAWLQRLRDRREERERKERESREFMERRRRGNLELDDQFRRSRRPMAHARFVGMAAMLGGRYL